MVISFDRIAEIYDETRGYPGFVMDKVVKTLVTEFEGYSGILDVGVGTARFSKPLQDNGYYVVGVDVSLGMLRRAVGKGVRDLVVGTACSLPFPNDSFDVTISVGLLHLVKEWKLALKEMSRVTRHFLVSVVHWGKSPASEEYRNLLISQGWKFPQLGIAERELAAMIKPLKSIHIASYEANVRESLDFLGRKAYSHQWDIPEEKHRYVMQRLKGKSFPDVYSEKIEILVWDMRNIREFVRLRKD